VKPPKSVQVGPHPYSVRVSASGIAARSHQESTCLSGHTDLDLCEITIDPKMVLSQKQDTLLHEVLHALFSLVGCELSHDDEEKLVRRLAPALLQAMQANPALVNYLTA
jgi:hypothetical protein